MLTEKLHLKVFNVNLVFPPPVLVCTETKLPVCGIAHTGIHIKELCKHC